MGLPGRWRNGGRGGSRESGKVLTKPLQQARSSGCSSEGGRGQAGEHWVPGRSFLPQSLESRGGWELAQGLGEGQGLSQTLKGQWRGGEGRHATLPMPMPGPTSPIEDYTGLSHQAQAEPQLLCSASNGHSRLIRVEASCDPVAGTGLELGVCVLRG